MITALMRRGKRRHVFLTREGVVLVDPMDGFSKATLFVNRQNAGEGVALLQWMRDCLGHEDLEKLDRAQLSVEETRGGRAKALSVPTVITILTPYNPEQKQRPAGFVTLWGGWKGWTVEGPKRVRSAWRATIFADVTSADGARAFVQTRFRSLTDDHEPMTTREYERVSDGPVMTTQAEADMAADTREGQRLAAAAADEADAYDAYVGRMDRDPVRGIRSNC